LIHANLDHLEKGRKVGLVVIGALTQEQLDGINHLRAGSKSPAHSGRSYLSGTTRKRAALWAMDTPSTM
jgi:hypothetical protein